MTVPVRQALAALACATASLALAQSGDPNAATTLSNANVPTTTPDVTAQSLRAAGRNASAVPAVPFVSEAVAHPMKNDSPDPVNGVVQALNAEPSLKNAKITVQKDGDNILLSGAALTRAQVKKAGEVALAQAGDAKVVNIVLDDET